MLASTASGCLIALGSDADVLSWYTALPGYPELHLLTVSAAAMRLMAVYPAVSNQGPFGRGGMEGGNTQLIFLDTTCTATHNFGLMRMANNNKRPQTTQIFKDDMFCPVHSCVLLKMAVLFRPSEGGKESWKKGIHPSSTLSGALCPSFIRLPHLFCR